MRYRIILADPPWFFQSRSTWNKTRFGGGVNGQYNVMTDRQLLELGPLIKEISDEHCALFIWHVPSRSPAATEEIMRAWGFKYSTKAFTWVKLTTDGTGAIINPGYTTAANTEDVFVGYTKPFPPERKLLSQVVFTNGRMEHSRKPDEIQDRIDLMYPGLPKLELFARRQRPGWTCTGLQLDGEDVTDFLIDEASRSLLKTR